VNELTDALKAALITGQHTYDALGMHGALRSISGVDWVVQSLDNFAGNEGDRNGDYDVLVFYNFHQEIPGGETNWWEQGQREVLERLGSTGQGLLILHHAILAYPEWDFWSDLTGISKRTFDYRDRAVFEVTVADKDHAITAGLPDSFVFEDETYLMDPADEGNHVLLETESADSMRTIAWTRRFRDSDVFCYQSGHGAAAFAHPVFREVLARGVRWLARDRRGGDRP
jgi:hypothetical protein